MDSLLDDNGLRGKTVEREALVSFVAVDNIEVRVSARLLSSSVIDVVVEADHREYTGVEGDVGSIVADELSKNVKIVGMIGYIIYESRNIE